MSVELTFTSTEPSTDEQFESFLDQVMIEFDNIGCEVSLAARLAERRADFATTVEADTIEGAAADFMPNLRAALHAAGCVTAGWPEFKPERHVIRELQDV